MIHFSVIPPDASEVLLMTFISPQSMNLLPQVQTVIFFELRNEVVGRRRVMFRAIYHWFFPCTASETPTSRLSGVSPAKVAIVGAGVGGCCAASFLRELGGEGLEIYVYSDGPVGGRTATAEVDGHQYETGGSVIHKSNQYLVDFAKHFGKKGGGELFRPRGTFNFQLGGGGGGLEQRWKGYM